MTENWLAPNVQVWLGRASIDRIAHADAGSGQRERELGHELAARGFVADGDDGGHR